MENNIDYSNVEIKLECKTTGHNKFYNIKSNLTEIVITYGRIGTFGIRNTKTYFNKFETERTVLSTLKEKISKGYSVVNIIEGEISKPVIINNLKLISLFDRL